MTISENNLDLLAVALDRFYPGRTQGQKIIKAKLDPNTGLVIIQLENDQNVFISHNELEANLKSLHAPPEAVNVPEEPNEHIKPFDFDDRSKIKTLVEIRRLPKHLSTKQLVERGKEPARKEIAIMENVREIGQQLITELPVIIPKLNPKSSRIEYFEMSLLQKQTLTKGDEEVSVFPIQFKQLQIDHHGVFSINENGFANIILITPQSNSATVFTDPSATEEFRLDYNLEKSRIGGLINMIGLMLGEAHRQYLSK